MERAKTKLRPAAFGLLVLAALTGASAYAADKHVHGHAALEVAVDGNRLQLNFTSPLDNLVGFEHAPRTDKQKDAVRRMAEQLNKPGEHFVLTAEARCTPGPVALASKVIDPSLLGAVAPQPGADKPPAKAARDKGGPKGHAELQAEIVFRCEHPEKLTSLEVKLFDAFRGMKRIDVQVAGARKQAAARLTPKSRRVSW
jgi:hypothetical protein